MVGMAFQAIAGYLTKLEDSPEDWHHWHSRVHKLFPFYPADHATLDTLRITTVSQIFDTHLSGRIDKAKSPELLASLAPYPALQHKLPSLHPRLLTSALPQQILLSQNPPCCLHESLHKPQSTLQVKMSRIAGLRH